MGRSALRFAFVCVVLACACWLAPAAADAAEVTIGAQVDQPTPESGTCAFEDPGDRPCLIVTNTILGQEQLLTSPCDGTVTRFRLNGIPRPANHYSLRVVRRNSDGSYTGTATSAPVAIATEGVNEYATNLPIAKGELLGIDFRDSTEEHGLRWVGGSGVSAAVLFDFPEDGTPAAADIASTQFYYLFNGDVACAGSPAPPAPAPPLSPILPTPSNAFHVVSLKKSTLTVSLDSPGTLAASEAPAKKKGGKKAAPLLLKPSSASGGPGPVKLKLKLTGAAKAKLRETGKVKVKATLAFTPTGGTKSVQVRGFKVKEKAKRKTGSS
jgi:hypothetical protein